MTEPKKKRSWNFTGGECEGCVYISVGVIIGCAIIGFIVWQLVLLGQILGVIIGLITFSSLLVTFFAYLIISGRDDNPSLAFKLKVVATILFVLFLIEAIFTFRFFWTPIFFPIISQLLASANWVADSGFVMILVIGFFIIIIAAYFSIPVCLWTSICRSSKDKEAITTNEISPTTETEEKVPPKVCPACGEKLMGIEKFCGNCGAAI